MQIQTHGLLSEIKSRTWSRGDDVVAWSDIERFMARFGQADIERAIRDWADQNMMWVEFQRDADGKIANALFGASK